MTIRIRRIVVVLTACALAIVGIGPVHGSSLIDPLVNGNGEPITVRTSLGTATVELSPFRIRYADASGVDVLSHLDVDPPGPQPMASLEPEPFAADHLDRAALHAPVTYLVGASRTVQPCPGNVCGGNQLTGLDAGVEFASTDVIATEAVDGPDGPGVRLTVATNEPTGRRLVVDVTPGPDASIRTQVTPVPAAGVVAISSSFATTSDEAFRGFGGRHNALDQRGEAFYSWPEQENSDNPDAAGLAGRDPETYQFPNGPHAAYYVQALFYSSNDYGFLLNQTDLSWFRLASESDDAWQVAAVSDHLDYVVAPGDAPTAMRTITGISGRHRVSPEWAFGAMTSLWHPFARLDPEKHRNAVYHDLAMIEAHDVEMEAYFLNGWNMFDEAEQRELLDRFHALDVKLLTYFTAFADDNTHGFTPEGLFEEVIAKGFAVKTAAGTPYLITSPLVAGLAVMIDFTNPDAVSWWKGLVKERLAFGYDGFMEDFGEQISVDMHFHNGETGASMHNAYPNYYHAATRAAIEEFEADPVLNPTGRRVWNFTRSGFSGTTSDKRPVPGSAASEYSNFPGDNSANWTQASGLKSAATDMLSRAVGGAWSYQTDIGGYLGDTPEELFWRWTQWAALSPMFRLHNSSSNGTRQPWFFDEGCGVDTPTAECPTVQLWNRYARLHARARPLIMQLAQETQTSGIPPTRPMWLAFPGQPQLADVDQQWMLGPDVLVAPVVDEGATGRTVAFPPGCWEHGDDPALVFEGPAEAVVPAPIDSLPWFVPCGTDPLAAATNGEV